MGIDCFDFRFDHDSSGPFLVISKTGSLFHYGFLDGKSGMVIDCFHRQYLGALGPFEAKRRFLQLKIDLLHRLAS
jgi:hypothetical protein